jgi:parvulin-like peptidyl-prolyl isomerase
VPQLEVKAGEKLLVPVKPEERKRRREIAEQLRQRLLKGEHVTTAALSITEPRVLVAMNGGLYTPEYDRISPAAAKAIREMTSNTATVTEPLDGPYGYDLYVLQARTTTNTQPFEEVRERILTAQQENQTFQQRLREDLRIEVFNELRSTHSLEINTPALERADYGGADPLTGATWIVRAKDFTLTLDDYLRELSAGDRSWGAMTPAQRIEVAKSMPAVIRQLVLMESNRQNLDSNPALQSLLKSKEIQEISKEWFRRRAKEDGDTTIGVLQEYYTKNIDRYTSRSMVTVREITRRYDPALPAAEKVASMERAKAGVAELRTEAVKSKEAFEAAARRGSASISTRSRGGLIGTVPINFRGPVVEAELLKLKVGEVTPPLIYGSEAMILRLDDFVGGVVQPFEQVGNLVLRDFANEIPKSRRENRRAEVFKEANFKIQF